MRKPKTPPKCAKCQKGKRSNFLHFVVRSAVKFFSVFLEPAKEGVGVRAPPPNIWGGGSGSADPPPARNTYPRWGVRDPPPQPPKPTGFLQFPGLPSFRVHGAQNLMCPHPRKRPATLACTCLFVFHRSIRSALLLSSTPARLTPSGVSPFVTFTVRSCIPSKLPVAAADV